MYFPKLFRGERVSGDWVVYDADFFVLFRTLSSEMEWGRLFGCFNRHVNRYVLGDDCRALDARKTTCSRGWGRATTPANHQQTTGLGNYEVLREMSLKFAWVGPRGFCEVSTLRTNGLKGKSQREWGREREEDKKKWRVGPKRNRIKKHLNEGEKKETHWGERGAKDGHTRPTWWKGRRRERSMYTIRAKKGRERERERV